jgi:signal transduction histidine kinase
VKDWWPAPWRDAILPGAVAVVAVVEMAFVAKPGWPVAAALELSACLVLCWRRRWPMITSIAAGAAVLGIPWVGPALNDASTPVVILLMASFSLARWLPDLRGILGVAAILLMTLLDYVAVDSRDHGIGDVIFVLALIAPPFVLGRITRKLSEQKAQLLAQQELIRGEAIQTERDRIARELHDVIAHSVSAMVVQTAAAQDLVRSDPARAEAILADVAATGRDALSETGRLLHVIRDDADELGLAPTPGVADVGSLVEQFRASGLAVHLDLAEPLPELPAGVDVSAYRIVQEALTNALKYGDRTAELTLATSPAGLSIRASNPAASSTPASNGRQASGSGLGLLGMAERVSLLGGRLEHCITAEGRFELTAVIPVSPGAS